MDPVRVWIDGDFALGLPDTTVDDAFALAALLRGARGGRVEVVGVSAVSGQVDGATALRFARDVTWAAGVEAPLVDEAGAADALAAARGELSVLALGPLTNVMGAALLDPDFPRRTVVRAVTSVNAAWRKPVQPLLDTNRRMNPVAADALWTAPFLARRVYPLDVAATLRLAPDDLVRLDAKGGPLGRLLATGSQWWARRARWRHPRGGFPVRDLVPALDVMRLLPGAEYDADGVLRAFDAAAAHAAALDLLGDSPPGLAESPGHAHT
jgi:inosine-uridine nucleoside N-ribohydrolase